MAAEVEGPEVNREVTQQDKWMVGVFMGGLSNLHAPPGRWSPVSAAAEWAQNSLLVGFLFFFSV